MLLRYICGHPALGEPDLTRPYHERSWGRRRPKSPGPGEHLACGVGVRGEEHKMALRAGAPLLRSRYTLLGKEAVVADGVSESWLAAGEYDRVVLCKVWPFEGERDAPDDVRRALWDAELRNLYRVGSSPGADESLLVLIDSGVDREARCFVMVLEAPGYGPLTTALSSRAGTAWLSNRDASARRALWSGLARLANGLQLLHEQQVLHRRVGADVVFLSPEEGATSLRLGGFEWSVRLGLPAASDPPPDWSSPPEFLTGAVAYSPETDWFGFGMLAVRCLLDVERYTGNPPLARYQRVLEALSRAGPRDLSELEQRLLLRLIGPNPKERLTRGHEVRSSIADIVERLDWGGGSDASSKPCVLAVNPANDGLIDELLAAGMKVEGGTFNRQNPVHTAALTSFLKKDLLDAQCYAVGPQPGFILQGATQTLRIAPHRFVDRTSGTISESWDVAFCVGTTELRVADGPVACVQFPHGRISVRTLQEVNRDRTIRQTAESWERRLPIVDRVAQLRANLARFHDFVRCANQVELLIRDAEIFTYHMVEQGGGSPGVERVVVREVDRSRPVLEFCKIEKGMAEFLQRSMESDERDEARRVVLTGLEQDSLMVPWVGPDEHWTIHEANPETGLVELHRPFGGHASPVEPEGTLRSYGMFGQVSLIKRRKRAIDRLQSHSYLLRSLSSAGQVYMDTGLSRLPVELDPDQVDEAKRACIEDILRVRPIYALQGPPGTGKTTLVAWLLREILADDPVAQVLVTAQAHGAVDVLRDKVRREAFRDVPEEDQPLAVRLGGGKKDRPSEDESSVEGVALRILEGVDAAFAGRSLSDLQKEWALEAEAMSQALRDAAPNSSARDFCELVRRGSNLTYCTTSAGELEALADMTQSFDWSILEEAGKAHGFDLALPLQAGHRWLLIGDHKQLPPYRFEDYRAAIDNLDAVVDALWTLPERAGGLVDVEWLRSWKERTLEERADFRAYARQWLNTFEQVFDQCQRASGALEAERQVTREEPTGAAAGMLSGQHRMHPLIGTLISEAYYRGELVNKTIAPDGSPIARVRHPFTQPTGIEGRAIVWVDTPWVNQNSRFAEVGPADGKPRYSNEAEAEVLAAFLANLGPGVEGTLELAVLSPYTQQVNLIARHPRLRSLTLAAGVSAKPSLRRARSRSTDRRQLCFTVDSFQGNQADIIAVSLVRNNADPPGAGLGFLDQAPRINVLLSRAERLLVLVGSWEFFCHQVSLIDSTDDTHPKWHWKQAVTTLGRWFDEGAALRLPADAIGDQQG